ncbi:nad(p)h nitroreductase ydgi-related [Anaeramoeba flamelloides]|uniref:Nad(P)h nitroreductase ydgi-related n=1 Tax=Anaeramoeba flamelloides TaxID=1746091 RepID=A0ABQ8XNA3_9EUKA|nr:nad(p)h nitroreductase ydgi-related [Anaeramoeba flamelloides]
MEQSIETITKRRSMRAYEEKEVSEETLSEIIRIARSAPSAGNLQSYYILSVRNKKLLKKLWKHSMEQDQVKDCSVLLVFCADLEQSAKKYRSRGRDLYCIQDATIVCAYAQLACQFFGLGSCWVGSFFEEEVAETLELDQTKYLPIALLPIGFTHPDEKKRMAKRPKKRKDLEEVYKKL